MKVVVVKTEGVGWFVWRDGVPFPVIYPTREQAEAAAEMVKTGDVFRVVA